ncbi:MAG: GntR family transcriptional regulator [Dethiobacteria bacterium]|jgi:GntR family transcriptional regulator
MNNNREFYLKQITIDKNSVIPIYYQLAKQFSEKIRSGSILPDEALPTESEIAAYFGISRMTVRRAISELAAAGMIYTQRGKGTFVARPKLDKIVFNLENFNEEIRQQGLEPHRKLLEARIVRADQKLARKLGIDLHGRCLYFRVVVTANNEPLVYETKYTVYAKQRPILETELKDPSLSVLAASHSNSLPTNSKKILMVSKTTEEESAVLGVSLHTPVFLIIQTIFDQDQNPIAWGKSIYRGDRYKLIRYDGWYKKE